MLLPSGSVSRTKVIDFWSTFWALLVRCLALLAGRGNLYSFYTMYREYSSSTPTYAYAQVYTDPHALCTSVHSHICTYTLTYSDIKIGTHKLPNRDTLASFNLFITNINSSVTLISVGEGGGCWGWGRNCIWSVCLLVYLFSVCLRDMSLSEGQFFCEANFLYGISEDHVQR